MKIGKQKNMPGICITTLAVSPHPNDTQSFIHSSNFLPRCYSSNLIHTIAFLHRHLPSPQCQTDSKAKIQIAMAKEKKTIKTTQEPIFIDELSHYPYPFLESKPTGLEQYGRDPDKCLSSREKEQIFGSRYGSNFCKDLTPFFNPPKVQTGNLRTQAAFHAINARDCRSFMR